MARPDQESPSDRPRAFEQAFGSGGVAFRRRLWIGAAVTGAVLAGVAGLLAWRQYDNSRERALDEAHTRVVLAGSILDTYFEGEISALTAIAAAPAIVAGDESAMQAYFRRVQPTHGELFNGGIGWIDRAGNSRVSSTVPAPRAPVNVSDRSYFKAVVSTGKPFVSEGIIARRTGQQILVMAVPTRDKRGRLTGVLAGSLLVNPAGNSQRPFKLGFEGLSLLDRDGQLVLSQLEQPQNTALLARMRSEKAGLVANTKGLEGASDHMVAFATAPIPQWTIAIDRPRSGVFAAARRGLILELSLIGACVLLGVALIAWISLRARREAAKEQERSEQWSELTRALGGASEIDDVSDALVSSLGTAFPAACTMLAIEVDGRLGLRLAGTSDDSLQPVVAANEALFVNAAELAYESRGPVEINSEEDLHERLPSLDRALAGRARSLYGVPLIARGGRGPCTGALVLFFPDERVLDDDERTFVAAHAEQTTEALARAREAERDRNVAVHLQRTLLPTDLPDPEGVDLATRYQAGAMGLEVGGDWYDAVRRSDGIVHLTVGDVAGRGIVAAAIMGRLRNAFRAYACDHTSPAEIVRRLTRHMGDDEMATTVCLTIDPYTCELAYASAGHLPPALVDGEGGALSWLDEVSSPPLGFVQATAIGEAHTTFGPGATVVAYTDGLVERRGTSIDYGMELLGSVIRGGAPSLDADGLAARILNEVALRRSAEDDIALLVVRMIEVPSRMEIEIPAHPAVLAGLRKRLRAWLELRGLNEVERADAVLAISEACNNAVEHAYEHNEGTIELLLEHEADSLRVTIDDHGVWRPSRSTPERGRGSSIMRSVMDKADIAHDDNGTRVTLERRLTRN